MDKKLEIAIAVERLLQSDANADWIKGGKHHEQDLAAHDAVEAQIKLKKAQELRKKGKNDRKRPKNG